MPLTGDPQGRCSFELENLVRFPMFDRERFVPCGVTPAALLKLAVDKGVGELNVEDVFARFRLPVEAIASAKYDRDEMIGEEVIIDISDI